MSFDRFRIPEILFKPSIAELEGKGIQQAVYDAIMSLDPDIDRKDVYGNIVLSGQASMFEGIADRLQKEIVPLAPAVSSRQWNNVYLAPIHSHHPLHNASNEVVIVVAILVVITVVITVVDSPKTTP